VVGTVTKFYINQSCFRGLAKGARYQVVKAILQVLTKPDVEAAALVEFEIEPALLRHCRGIVGSNVEKANGMYCYLDGAWKCPCKVSACLTIVLFELLGFASELASDWSSFETVCTLALIQDTILKTEPQVGFRLVELKTPFPSGTAKNTTFVPRCNPHDVIRNGPKASHGDGFAHNEIMQVKHARNRDSVDCSFWDEAYKAGLLKDDRKSVHAFATALLYEQWNSAGCVAAVTETAMDATVTSVPTRNGRYPASLLEMRRDDGYDVVTVNKVQDDGDNELWIRQDDGAEVAIPASFNPPITFSIFTNADSIELALVAAKKTETFEEHESMPLKATIRPTDVDFDGFLDDANDCNITLKRSFEAQLKAGVKVRFRFCRGV
jgi:hypothetical protein